MSDPLPEIDEWAVARSAFKFGIGVLAVAFLVCLGLDLAGVPA